MARDGVICIVGCPGGKHLGIHGVETDGSGIISTKQNSSWCLSFHVHSTELARMILRPSGTVIVVARVEK